MKKEKEPRKIVRELSAEDRRILIDTARRRCGDRFANQLEKIPVIRTLVATAPLGDSYGTK